MKKNCNINLHFCSRIFETRSSLVLTLFLFTFLFLKQDTLKIEEFERINMKSVQEVRSAIRKYMKVGLMVGTFEVYGDALNQYGQSEAIDAFYVLQKTDGVNRWTHVVTITGYGIQAKYPLWEFQNSYGPMWRGAARGFGQIYALHLPFLYGFVLP